MELLVLRHAEALPVSKKHPTDEERPLSADGERVAEEVGRRAAESGIVPDRILASPLLRARQTADRFAKSAGAGAPTLEPRLAPGGNVSELLRELSSKNGRVAIVGHEPTMSAVVGKLLGRDRTVAVTFRPATLAHLEISPTRDDVTLLALLPPPAPR